MLRQRVFEHNIGGHYTLTFRARATMSGLRMWLWGLGSFDAAAQNSAHVNVHPPTYWKDYSFSYTASSKVPTLEFKYKTTTQDGQSRAIYIDDVAIAFAPTPPPTPRPVPIPTRDPTAEPMVRDGSFQKCVYDYPYQGKVYKVDNHTCLKDYPGPWSLGTDSMVPWHRSPPDMKCKREFGPVHRTPCWARFWRDGAWLAQNVSGHVPGQRYLLHFKMRQECKWRKGNPHSSPTCVTFSKVGVNILAPGHRERLAVPGNVTTEWKTYDMEYNASWSHGDTMKLKFLFGTNPNSAVQYWTFLDDVSIVPATE